MATSAISNTIRDLDGTAIPNVPVVARLRPGPGFRISDSHEVASEDRTITDASGHWVLNLERNANINPSGTYYEVEESIPARSGGTRVWLILVGSVDSNLFAALITPPPVSPLVGSDFLTQAQGDARYGSLVDTTRNNVARRLYLRQNYK